MREGGGRGGVGVVGGAILVCSLGKCGSRWFMYKVQW